MKIGFIGNTNNYPFTLAAALMKRGIDVTVIVDSDYILHRPENRLPHDRVGYGSRVFDLAPMRTWDVVLPTPKRRRALRLLGDCDAIVANGWGIAFSTLLDKPSFVISTGSDLDMLASNAHLSEIAEEGTGSAARWLRSRVKTALYRRLIPMQRSGFRDAIGVEYAFPGVLPHGDAILEDIGVPQSRRQSFFLTDLDQLKKEPLPTNPVMRILGVARINWKEPLWPGSSVLDNKRTDRLVEGVARHRNTTGQRVELRLFRKGLNVAETDALAQRLGLGSDLVWLDEMSQRDFMSQIIEADVVADHFGEGTIGIGARDALALGRPVLAGGSSEAFEAAAGEPLPIVHARTVTEIADALTRLQDRSERLALADRSRAFAERHFSADKAAETILGLFRQ